MSKKELHIKLLGFIEAIRTVETRGAAKELQKQIENFYNSNDVPEEEDLLANSGFCELLSMLAD